MAIARNNVVQEGAEAVYHCFSRCVRQAFLIGSDPRTGRSNEHRKAWIVERLRHLAGHFGVDVCGYAVMSNHLHVVLRTRPDLVEGWSDEEVQRRWRGVFNKMDQRAAARGKPARPMDPRRIAELRVRLSSVSWFMRCLNEYVARMANREDGCKGRFWDGRFRCQALLDEAAVLTCLAYVDLNPIRANVAKTPEESEYTSAWERIEARKARRESWLCPIGDESPTGRPGLLDLGLDDYLALVDWTGRHYRPDKAGAIPEHLAPIFERLGVNHHRWREGAFGFGRLFRLAAGRMESMSRFARQTGKSWLVGQGAVRALFAPN